MLPALPYVPRLLTFRPSPSVQSLQNCRTVSAFVSRMDSMINLPLESKTAADVDANDQKGRLL
jgi:hypothetical protein